MENTEKKVPDIVAEAEKIISDKFLREYGRSPAGHSPAGHSTTGHAASSRTVGRGAESQQLHGGFGLNICMVIGCLFFTLVFFG